jgi:hypothetical protein
VIVGKHATPSDWVEAASRIAWNSDGDHANQRDGDSLRVRSAPSVSALLVKRIASTDPDVSCQLTGSLLAWDTTAAIPIAAKKLKDEVALDDCVCVGMLTKALVRANQLAALDDYAAFMARSKPSPSGAGDKDCFLPMQQLPGSPGLTKAAEAAFRDGSPWIPVVSPKSRGRMVSHFMLEDDSRDSDGKPFRALVTVAAFNRHVVKALADKRVFASLVIGADSVDIDGPDEQSTLGFERKPDTPAAGTKSQLRVCDFYAWNVSTRAGAPAFEPYWSVTKRDAAIAAIAKWLPTQIAP